MRVKWLSAALQNLDDEAEFVARDDPAAARALVRRIHEAIGHLKANPALGRDANVVRTGGRVGELSRLFGPHGCGPPRYAYHRHRGNPVERFVNAMA